MSSFPELVYLNVTPDDIAGGEKGNPWTCAVARALTRQLGARDATVVDNLDIVVEGPGGTVVNYTGSKALGNFIALFDKLGASVRPRRFRLDKVETSEDE